MTLHCQNSAALPTGNPRRTNLTAYAGLNKSTASGKPWPETQLNNAQTAGVARQIRPPTTIARVEAAPASRHHTDANTLTLSVNNRRLNRTTFVARKHSPEMPPLRKASDINGANDTKLKNE